MIGSAQRENQKIEAARQTEDEILQILERSHIIKNSESANEAESAFDQTEVEPEVFELL